PSAAPEAAAEALSKSRALSRKQKGSRNRYRARQRLSRAHGRIRSIRHDLLHRHSTQLAQTHGHLILEQLSICGLIRTRLASSPTVPGRCSAPCSPTRQLGTDAPCGVCVKLFSMKQKGPRSNVREGRCCRKLSTRCSAALLRPCRAVGDPLANSVDLLLRDAVEAWRAVDGHLRDALDTDHATGA